MCFRRSITHFIIKIKTDLVKLLKLFEVNHLWDLVHLANSFNRMDGRWSEKKTQNLCICHLMRQKADKMPLRSFD